MVKRRASKSGVLYRCKVGLRRRRRQKLEWNEKHKRALLVLGSASFSHLTLISTPKLKQICRSHHRELPDHCCKCLEDSMKGLRDQRKVKFERTFKGELRKETPSPPYSKNKAEICWTGLTEIKG